MSNDGTKARTKPRVSRPKHFIGDGEYTLNPCDVAQERELRSDYLPPFVENDSLPLDDFRKLEPEPDALSRPDLWGEVFDELSDEEFAELVHQRAARSPAFAARLGLSPSFEKATVPAETSLTEFSAEQLQTYHAVAAARSRAQRAQMTPEQAVKEREAGAKRSLASRARMSPEQRAQRSAKEAERLRLKRAAAKAPQP